MNQSEVGWCKRHAPYLNSSEAAQDSLGHLEHLHTWNSAQLKTSSPELTQLDPPQHNPIDSTKAVLLQHTTLGRVEISFSVVS